ncbi:MAG: hypothetical protein AMXMBFR23_15330 [Chloroflexota bacterium]
MTEDALANLETAVEALLVKQQPHPTPERIRELISTLRSVPGFEVEDATAEELARIFEARHSVTMTVGSVLMAPEYEPWLDQAKARIDPYYWDRYRKLLTEQHFSGQVISTLDEVTDRVLGLLENPLREGPWDRRGMVVGHVQSGKTANYTGLICKAADAGYRLIVVIAGVHNNLRNQTQLRIDEGFVGRDSARLLSKSEDRFIGVGRFDRTRRPVTFTNSVRDFNKVMATGVGIPLDNLNEPAVFVIKKHSSTLRNLIEWIREHSAKAGGTVSAPMLLIDDEADNASINVRGDGQEPSRINAQIRTLLGMFDRSCYVGYTATPFANIFIDPDSDDEMFGDDLFPRHFIVSLDPPSNYFGAERVFVQDAEAVIRHIEDSDDWLPLSHKKDAPVDFLPASLLDAIRTFIVGRAIRLARGHETAHCSMLINASRFTDVQRQIRNEVHHRLEQIQSSVRINGALPAARALRDPEINELHAIWETEFAETEFDWDQVQAQLHAAAAPVRVVEVNSNSAGNLNYREHQQTGLNVIAVGGMSLSRGLTLEGLMVSYFLRNSIMYDTLMQMGRWFGYRPDYDDLCRIWMPEEAEGWYAHITESIEMLREELRIMEAASATPEEFGLRVRSHPDTLIVTARNKMGSGQKVVVSVGLGNNFIETTTLWRDRDHCLRNRRAVDDFATALAGLGIGGAAAREVSGGWLLSDVPAGPITEFITAFANHPGSMLTESAPVRRYIEDRSDEELARWDVLIASIRETEGTFQDEVLGLPIYCQRRQPGKRGNDLILPVSNNQRVASRGIERTGMSSDLIRTAEQAYLDSLTGTRSTESRRGVNFPDWAYRLYRERPLLIIHLLKIDPPRPGAFEESNPVVAYSISFPRTEREEKRVEYVVNTTWMRENYQEEFGTEELDDSAG